MKLKNMVQKKSVSVSLCIVAVFLLLWCSKAVAGETVRIATGEFPPYVSRDLKHQGLVTRIVKEAFSLVGMDARFGFFPWKRSKSLARMGVWDACSFWAKMPAIEKDFYMSDTLVQGPLVFFYSEKTDFDWKTAEDLQGYRIGGVLGNIYGTAIAKAEKTGKIDIYRVSSEKEGLELLVAGGIEVFPVNREAGFHILHKNFSKRKISHITYHPKPIRSSDYRLIFSKKLEKNKKLVKRFNKGLDKLKKSGRHDRYLKDSREGAYITLK